MFFTILPIKHRRMSPRWEEVEQLHQVVQHARWPTQAVADHGSTPTTQPLRHYLCRNRPVNYHQWLREQPSRSRDLEVESGSMGNGESGTAESAIRYCAKTSNKGSPRWDDAFYGPNGTDICKYCDNPASSARSQEPYQNGLPKTWKPTRLTPNNLQEKPRVLHQKGGTREILQINNIKGFIILVWKALNGKHPSQHRDTTR